MIFGNKNTFAIEVKHDTSYTAKNYIFGSMCMWIENVALGNIDEPACILGVSYMQLKTVLESIPKQNIENLPKTNESDLFNFIDHKTYIGDDYSPEDHVFYDYDFMTNGGESFDNTKSFIIKYEDQYKIFFHDYDKKQSFYKTVDKSVFHNVIESFFTWHEEKTNQS